MIDPKKFNCWKLLETFVSHHETKSVESCFSDKKKDKYVEK